MTRSVTLTNNGESRIPQLHLPREIPAPLEYRTPVRRATSKALARAT